MKTWEAFQANRPVGRIRVKLARMIEEALPGVLVLPEDLMPQNPAFSRPEVDCCTWDAWGTMSGGRRVHFHSWSSMGEIVRSKGVHVTQHDGWEYEIDPLEDERFAKKRRLEDLRDQLHAECISYLELTELKDLLPFIDKDDVELLEAAGFPEIPGPQPPDKTTPTQPS